MRMIEEDEVAGLFDLYHDLNHCKKNRVDFFILINILMIFINILLIFNDKFDFA